MIRRAENSDYEEMDLVFRESAKALCIRNYEESKVLDWVGQPWAERFVESAAKGNDQFVKISNGKVVCFAELNTENSKLNSIFVLPDYAGKGIGQEMLNFLFCRAKEAGLQHLKLDASLNAVNFYQRNGFKQQGVSEFTTQNGVVLDSVQMICVFCN
ncbi:MAG: GNAT family N-acetyltransferase [Gammaproteobacteria bacterium]|nr:GNAT family N-acetyltransferase [Gammaproteobacteria bacterium]